MHFFERLLYSAIKLVKNQMNLLFTPRCLNIKGTSKVRLQTTPGG